MTSEESDGISGQEMINVHGVYLEVCLVCLVLQVIEAIYESTPLALTQSHLSRDLGAVKPQVAVELHAVWYRYRASVCLHASQSQQEIQASRLSIERKVSVAGN